MGELISLDDLTDLSQEELQAKITEANQKYQELQSNSDRGVQKVIAEKKLSEKALKSIADINGDNDKFVELYESDKELGEYILKNVFNGATIEEFKTGGGKAKPATENFEEFYQKKQAEERLEKVTSKLSKEAKERFDAEFTELTDGKKLTKENLDKYIKIVLKEIEPDFSEEIQEARSMAMGSGTSKPKESKSQGDQATTDFLVQMGVVKPMKKN